MDLPTCLYTQRASSQSYTPAFIHLSCVTLFTNVQSSFRASQVFLFNGKYTAVYIYSIHRENILRAVPSHKTTPTLTFLSTLFLLFAQAHAILHFRMQYFSNLLSFTPLPYLCCMLRVSVSKYR